MNKYRKVRLSRGRYRQEKLLVRYPSFNCDEWTDINGLIMTVYVTPIRYNMLKEYDQYRTYNLLN